MYKGIANTYLKGKKRPSIDEYQIFDNRKVEAGNYQAWPISTHYNQSDISDTCLALLEKMQTIAYLVIKNDSIHLERYWDGYSEESNTNSFSMAKTIVSILTGIAIDEGHIESVDQKVGDFFPEYSSGLNDKLTIKHLLTMSSGMNFSESYSNPFAFPAKAYFGDDLKGLMQKYKVVEDPGVEFEYLSGNTQLLGYCWKKQQACPYPITQALNYGHLLEQRIQPFGAWMPKMVWKKHIAVLTPMPEILPVLANYI